MGKLKVNLSVLLDGGHPKKENYDRREAACNRLKEKVDYAIGLIECNHRNKWMAIEFLQSAYTKLDALKHPSEDMVILKENIWKAISDYGHYHLPSKKEGKQ